MHKKNGDNVFWTLVESATLKRNSADVLLINQPTYVNYFAAIPSIDSQLNPNL